jgi:hypothetical protein
MGSCEADGHCSVADDHCASGRRFVAAGALTDVCVGASDAGAPGEGGVGTLGGLSRCAQAGALLCDGFEAGAIDRSIWTGVGNRTEAGATAMVVGDRVARGAYALHVTLPATSTNTLDVIANIAESSTFPRSAFYLREFIYLSGGNTVELGGLLDGTNSRTFTLGLQGGFPVIADYGHNFFGPSQLAVPMDRWVCLELQLDFSSASGGVVGLRVDDQPVVDLSATHVMPPLSSPFALVGVGVHLYHSATPTIEAWIDELVIDDKPIGCGR